MAAATSRRGDEYGFGVDAGALREFFQEYETRVGIRSANMESIYILAAEDGAKPWSCGDCRKDWWSCRCRHPKSRRDREPGDGPPPESGVARVVPQSIGAHGSWDHYADIVPYLTASKRVYRALKSLDDNGGSHHVVVLWRMYGPHNHHGDEPSFGEYGGLASFTDAVEDARTELACEVSGRLADLVGPSVERAHAVRRPDIEEEFWRVAGTIVEDQRRCAALTRHEATLAKLGAVSVDGMSEKRRDAHASALAYHAGRVCKIRKRLQDTARIVQAADDFQGQLLDAYACDGSIRARCGVIATTDRETTAADAIRWKLRPPPPTATPEERSQFTDERIRFVSRVKIQALAMHKAAHAAYREALMGAR